MKTYQVSVCVTYIQEITVRAKDALSATTKACDIALKDTPKNAEYRIIQHHRSPQ